ncbi:MAG: P-II family nitrogen regulator [Oscillospiraceae bacterium]|nr:P-II family nitrogen regulator [Oscillospiraceae bacterium]
MELYMVLSIVDRNRREDMASVYESLGLSVSLTMLGRGTASRENLLRLGLNEAEKAVMATFADGEYAKKLIRKAEEKMYIDIPGNGIMLSVPVKSVGGRAALEQLSGKKPVGRGIPSMEFTHELIYVILNEGHSDEVMDAARPAGAAGGTVIAAKGTGIARVEKFRSLTLAEEKEVVLIVARAENKSAIMKAIMEKAGVGTPAGAICFSMPVSEVAGLRRLEEE